MKETETSLSSGKLSRRRALQLAGLSGVAATLPAGRSEAATGGTLRVGIIASGPTEPIDPVAGYSTQTCAIAVFDRLTWITPDLTVVPALATSWEHSPDLKEWTFSLRSGVQFHDGRPFTARDVVRTFQRILNPKLGSQAYRVLSLSLDPEGVVAADDHTVKFTCKAPFWNLPAIASNTHASVVPEDSPLDAYLTHPVGTGPFKLEAYHAGVHTFTSRNEHYWRAGYPKLDGIRFFNVTDDTQRVSGMISGQLDLILRLNPVAIQSIKSDRRFTIARAKSGNCLNINMRASKKPLDDNRVRQALKLACNRAAQVQEVWLGEATEGSDQPISPVSKIWGGIEPAPYDIAQAKQLLAAAGYPNGIDITLVTTQATPGAVEQAEAYQQQAAPAGIRVKVQQVPGSAYNYNVDAGKYDFWVESWAMRPDDTLFFLEYARRGKKLAPTEWYPPEFRTFLQAARTAPDEKSRLAKFAALQKLVAEQGPSINPVFINVIDTHTRKVLNYQPSPLLYYRNYWELELAKS
ncbi:MAG: ABC transporter substrate-binding protein [Acetobacteraceae bacterium]